MNELPTGSLCVLNVGAGDIRVTFNQQDKGESAKAIKMLQDMQARGYFIAVELPDGSYTRVQQVDASRGRYVITVPEEAQVPPEAEPVKPTRYSKGGNGRRAGKRVSVPVSKSKAIGVARSAGG